MKIRLSLLQAVFVVCLLPSNPGFAQTAVLLPDCSSADSDSDGDGFGWENGESCMVIDGQAMQAQTGQCVDTDGDGFGWNGTDTCDPTDNALQTVVTLPECVSSASDSDGDGFGWENGESCLAGNGQMQTAQTGLCIDTDGDGFGWDGVDTCLPDGVDPSSIFFNGFTGQGTGSGSFELDDETLTGRVNTREGTVVNSVSLYAGNAAIGNGTKIFDLIADSGSSNSYSVPGDLTDRDTATVRDNLASANVYLEISFFDEVQQGERQDRGLLSSSDIYNPQLFVNGGNAVPPTDSLSRINAYFYVNRETGDLSVGVELFMRFSDVDPEGNPRTITAMHLRSGDEGETGPILLDIEFEREVSVHSAFVYSHWSAVSVLAVEDLSALLAGNVYFSAEGANGTSYQRGDFPPQ